MDKFVDGFIKEHKLYEDTVNYTRGVKDGAYNGAQLNKSATGYDKGTGVTYNIFEYTKPYPNTTNGVTMYATKKGYDGTIQRNVLDAAVKENNYPITDFTISNPSQVKSATDNVGTFDSNNEDIRYRKVDNSNEIERFSNDIMVEADKQLKNETDNSVFTPQYKKKFLVLDDKLSRSFNNYRSKAMKGDKYGFPKMFWDDKHRLVYIKSNNHRNSRRYNLVSTDTGEVLYSNMLLYTKEEAELS